MFNKDFDAADVDVKVASKPQIHETGECLALVRCRVSR